MFTETFSDHMCLLRAFQAWQKARSDGWEKDFCENSSLSQATMEMIVGQSILSTFHQIFFYFVTFKGMRSQLLGQLRATGFVRARGGNDIRDLNTNSENWAVVKVRRVRNTNICRIKPISGSFMRKFFP